MKRELQNREIYQAYDHMNRQDYFQSSYSIPEHLGTGFIHCYAIPWGIVIGEFFMRYRQDMVFRARAGNPRLSSFYAVCTSPRKGKYF